MGRPKILIKYSTSLNDYVAILVGAGVTLVVQSSSVTTSALTPLCDMGVLPSRKMLPMTFGANIGTTCTALISACVDLMFHGFRLLWLNPLQHHWYLDSVPSSNPLGSSCEGGSITGPICVLLQICPSIVHCRGLLGFACGVPGDPSAFRCLSCGRYCCAGGSLAAIAVLEFWWWKGCSGKSGALMILSEEQRYQGNEELVAANARMVGITEEQWESEANTLSWWGK